MSEQPLSTQEQIDQFTTSRILSDAELLKGGAIVKNGNLLATTIQINQIKQEHEQQSFRTPEESEKGHSLEDLRAMARNSFFVLSSHLLSGQKELRHIPEHLYEAQNGRLLDGSFGVQSGVLRGLSLVNQLDRDSEAKKLNDQGVTEKTSLHKAEEFMGGKVNFGKATDKYFVLKYQTTIASDGQYKFPDSAGRPGDFMDFTMLINGKDEADKLWAAINHDPKIIRNIVAVALATPHLSTHGNDMSMEQVAYSSEQQRAELPPYKQWAEINGNVNRMTLVDNRPASATEGKIVEFE